METVSTDAFVAANCTRINNGYPSVMDMDTRKRWSEIASDSGEDTVPAAKFSPTMRHLLVSTNSTLDNSSVRAIGNELSTSIVQTSNTEVLRTGSKKVREEIQKIVDWLRLPYGPLYPSWKALVAGMFYSFNQSKSASISTGARLRYLVRQLRLRGPTDQINYYVAKFLSDAIPTFDELRLTAELLVDIVPEGFAITPNLNCDKLLVITQNGIHWKAGAYEPTFVIDIPTIIKAWRGANGQIRISIDYAS